MFLQFIGINNKIINLMTIALIEDLSNDLKSKCVLTTTDGTEIEFEDSDADVLLARVETLLQATDDFLLKFKLRQTHKP